MSRSAASDLACPDLADALSSTWRLCRSRWHWPQLPLPSLGPAGSGEFPFQNYNISISDMQAQDPQILQSLLEHLIAHYVFCPRSLETAAILALAALRGMNAKDASAAARMVNIFSDIVVDSFRLERSQTDQELVVLYWRSICQQGLLGADRVVAAFLERFWQEDLGVGEGSFSTEVDLLYLVFSPGVRDRSLWQMQCHQMSRILSRLEEGRLGKGPVAASELLRGAVDHPLSGLAAQLDPEEYSRTLEALGLHGDLKRWYRDQGYTIRIRSSQAFRESEHPSAPARWRISDPPGEMDVNYSLSMSPWLIPGVTTYKRERERSRLVAGAERVPDLLVVLDSSRSMGGHSRGTRTFNATLAAFKACQLAHGQGAQLAAVNFSDRYLVQTWTRDLGAIEDLLVEDLCGRTSLPGLAILDLVRARPGCLVLCITDTQIQNMYLEWERMVAVASLCRFVLLCIDDSARDREVAESLGALGRVYHVNRPEDLLTLVVETAEEVYGHVSRQPSYFDLLKKRSS